MVLSCSISSEKAEEEITLAFVGDIMLGRQVGRAMQKAADPALPFRSVYHEIASADISIGNLECVFVDNAYHWNLYPRSHSFPRIRRSCCRIETCRF